MGKKRENLYQVACLRLFEATHKGAVAENVGNHPNAYFSSSRQYTKDTDKKKAAPVLGSAPEKPAPQAPAV